MERVPLAVQFKKRKPNMTIHLPALSLDIQSYLLQLARKSMSASIKNIAMEPIEPIPDIVKDKYGCFVTLTKFGGLRGCIGYIEGVEPLYRAVVENARNAALFDSRFKPIGVEELMEICIEISVLTTPALIVFKNELDLLNQLVPHEDGIVLEKGYRKSTFLPQVWEQLPEKRAFLENLAIKAGLPSDGWKSAIIKRYAVMHFSENK
jgi:AmmeMemoRadiSam system protein A